MVKVLSFSGYSGSGKSFIANSIYNILSKSNIVIKQPFAYHLKKMGLFLGVFFPKDYPASLKTQYFIDIMIESSNRVLKSTIKNLINSYSEIIKSYKNLFFGYYSNDKFFNVNEKKLIYENASLDKKLDIILNEILPDFADILIFYRDLNNVRMINNKYYHNNNSIVFNDVISKFLNKLNLHARKFFHFFGTHVIRNEISENFWIYTFLIDVINKTKYNNGNNNIIIIIDDLRFKNEFYFIKQILPEFFENYESKLIFIENFLCNPEIYESEYDITFLKKHADYIVNNKEDLINDDFITRIF